MTDFELFKTFLNIKNVEFIEKKAIESYITIFYSPLNFEAVKMSKNIFKLKKFIKVNICYDNSSLFVLNGKLKLHIYGFTKKFLDPDFISLLRSILLNKQYIETTYKRLKRADNNQTVLWLNKKLYSLDYLEQPKINSCYSESTYNAVLNFQKHNGLIEDGVVERITFEMLKNNFL